ncbi:hypothetical protein ACFQH5_20270 [Halomonas salifodinae]|uniref:Uncharacterized protein n=1 Tax=Halomonas salifodinae TaxID=438745 RepID=A0ABW2F772_9GAMM
MATDLPTLPGHLSPDGLTPDEHTQALIDELAAWSFAWDDDRNLVMLTEESAWLL